MEIWDLYDEQGNKTGETWERSRAKEIPEGRYHIVCDILIRHQDGSFLLTFRKTVSKQREMRLNCVLFEQSKRTRERDIFQN